MKRLMLGLSVATLALSVTGITTGQDMSGPVSAAMEKASRLLSQQSLTAKVVLTMTSTKKEQGPQGPIEFLMTMSKGKSRVEMDFAQMAGAEGGKEATMPPGMEKMVSITRPDKKVIYQVMPGLKGYCETAIPRTSEGKADSVKIDRKVEGSEKVEGYTCDKVRTTITPRKGPAMEFLTWEAKELNGLPVKMETATSDGKMTMLFKNIKTDLPSESVFEPPAGFTKYGSMQEMMMSSMKKMIPGH